MPISEFDSTCLEEVLPRGTSRSHGMSRRLGRRAMPRVPAADGGALPAWPGLAWPGLLSFFLSLCVFLGEDGEKGEGGMKGMDYGHTRTVAFDKSHFGKPA